MSIVTREEMQIKNIADCDHDFTTNDGINYGYNMYSVVTTEQIIQACISADVAVCHTTITSGIKDVICRRACCSLMASLGLTA